MQNSLRVCQWLLQKPNVTTFFGAVGNDDYRKTLEDKARSDGVNVQYQVTPDVPTGTCAALITGTKRSLCANLAAANTFKIDHILKDVNKNQLTSAEYFYISGFFITVSPETILHVAKYANESNKYFMMNLSAPFVCEFYKDTLIEALPLIDFLFGNESEALAFAKSCLNSDETDLKVIAHKIAEFPKTNAEKQRIVIITQGYLPVLVMHKGKLLEFPVQKLEANEIVDTNGAGDAFVGGFLAQFIQRKSIETCVKCGIWAAKQIIQRSGCTFEGLPGFGEA